MLPNVETREDRMLFYNTSTWKEKRQKILERDAFECQWCKEEGKVKLGKDKEQDESPLEVDHIQELKDCPELALEDSNLRTLCKDCHNKRHGRMNYRKSHKEKKWNDEWW
jgi:Restriction endonuclease